MTKLALYDKHEGASDRAANDYFRHDYIYRKNLGTRLSVGFGGMIILAIYWLRIIFIEGVDVFELYIQHHVFQSVMFILALMAVYSLIGTIQGTREYYLVQKRLERYQGMMRFLERIDERGRIRVEDRPKARAASPPETRPPERERSAPPVTRRPAPSQHAAPPQRRPGVASQSRPMVDDRTRPIVRPGRRPEDAPLMRLRRQDEK